MASSLVPVTALLLGAFFLFAAGGINGLLLPLRGTAEGMDTFWLGLLGTGWACGYVVGCLRVPRLVARVGHVRAFSAMASLASLSILASSLFVIAPVWVVLRAIAGFAFAGAAMIVESWLVDRTAPEQRGRVFAFYTMVILGASTLGQLSLAGGGTTGMLFFVIAAMLYSLALLPTAISSSATPQPLLQAKLDLKGLWRNSPLALVAALAIGISNGSFGTLAAVYAGGEGFEVATISLFVALPVLAGALAQMPVGLLSDRFDRRRVLVGVVLIAMTVDVAFLKMPPASTAVALGMAALFGAAVFTMYPLVVAHANDHAAGTDAIAISGSVLLVFGCGSMLGPLLGGALMGATGPSGLFMVTLTVHTLLLGYTLLRIVRREAVEEDDKSPFEALAPAVVATPQTAPFRTASDEALADEDVDVGGAGAGAVR